MVSTSGAPVVGVTFGMRVQVPDPTYPGSNMEKTFYFQTSADLARAHQLAAENGMIPHLIVTVQHNYEDFLAYVESLSRNIVEASVDD